MCVTMKQIKCLINFFEVHVKDLQKGAKNLLEKIEVYDEDTKILTEILPEVDLNKYITNGEELDAKNKG